jgi:eukaryotic-like serine/threonine-protein kinase
VADLKKKPDALIGAIVGGWTIHGVLGAGKSATVYAATKASQEAALKIFDADLVERSGRDKQLQRIQRELVVGRDVHPNLIRVLDGGECSSTGNLYVVMERVHNANLSQVLDSVPRDCIRPIITQVARAARALEELTPPVAHRDIKPDNIAISPDFKTATLLDLGVILPIDFKDSLPSSDEERKFFVGTLRYGPPEFIVREEERTTEAWRAVTFYQLGAVLHDLIMKKRLFEDYADPYPRLVMAIQQKNPVIEASDVSQELILLARNCLVKDPAVRLKFVKWQDFDIPLVTPTAAASAGERIRRRIGMMTDSSVLTQDERERGALIGLQTMQSELIALLRRGWSELGFPVPMESHLSLDVSARQAFLSCVLSPSAAMGLSQWLTVTFRLTFTDLSARLIEIGSNAAMSLAPVTVDLVKQQRFQSIFEGAFSKEIVKLKMQGHVVQFIDLAQTTPFAQGANLQWLNLEDKP